MKSFSKFISVLLSLSICLSVLIFLPNVPQARTEAAAAVAAGQRRLEAENYASRNAYGIEEATWHSSGKAVGKGTYQYSKLLTEAQLEKGVDTSNPYITYRVSAPVAGDYTLKIGYVFGTSGTVPSGTTPYIHIYINGKLIKYYGSKTPITVSLNKGINTIVCGVFSKELYTAVGEKDCWVNYDYIDIDDCIYASPSWSTDGGYLRIEAETDAELYNYSVTANDAFSNGKLVGNGYYDYTKLESAGETARKLNQYMPYITFYVNAPADGTYKIRPCISFWTAASTYPSSHYVYIYVNGVSYKATKSSSNPVIDVKMTKGVNVINCSIFDKNFYQSIGSANASIDYDAIDVSSSLTPIAPLDDRNVMGLVKNATATLNGDRVIYSDLGLNAATVKGNFMSGGGITLADSEGKELSATQRAAAGSIISYDSGPEYTVCYRGDENLDDCIDVRDLKKAKQHVFDSANTVDGVLGDINNDGKVDSADVTAYRDYILGKTSDTTYTRKTYGASALLSLCNPVGRLAEHKGSMLVEASAANFTLYGEMQGDVSITLHLEQYEGLEASLFVEIDGNTADVVYVKASDVSGLSQTFKLATGLSAGHHTLHVSKGSDLKNDTIFVDSITLNGTLTRAPAAERRIEYLGDSITSGHGGYPAVNGHGLVHSFYGYANLTADKFGADYYSISCCGWGFMHSLRDETSCIPCIYPLQSMRHDYGNYDYDEWQPDLVVINLGTNDYKVNGTEAQYIENVKYTLSMVRAARPNAKIIWGFGMMNLTNEEWIINGVNAYNEAANDDVTYICLPMNRNGDHNHPDGEGMAAGAEALSAKISEIMNWDIIE